MKKILLGILVFTSLFITGCSNNQNNDLKEDNVKIEDNNLEESKDDIMDKVSNIKVIINNKEYNATIEDNETAQTFVKTLPKEFNMSELNGNEKYYYMKETYPTKSYNPKNILAGDIMLYGNNCLVVFYKSFETSYSYTKIGHIDNLPNLGNGNITIRFE